MRKWWATLVLIGICVLGCSTNKTAPGAWEMCTHALPGKQLVSATDATVGSIRDWKTGPGGPPAAGAFGDLPAGTPAAWCWTREASDLLRSYGVTRDGQRFSFGTMQGFSGVPSGPPAFG